MCNTLEISKQNALKAYAQADGDGKELLSNLFGKDKIPGNVMDRIKTVDDAIREMNTTLEEVLPYRSPQNSHQRGLNAMAMMMVVRDALCEGWEADYSNTDQWKYEPRFIYKPGVGFSYYGYVDWSADAHVGSRLCFPSRELAEYFGRTFPTTINNFLSK